MNQIGKQLSLARLNAAKLKVKVPRAVACDFYAAILLGDGKSAAFTIHIALRALGDVYVGHKLGRLAPAPADLS